MIGWWCLLPARLIIRTACGYLGAVAASLWSRSTGGAMSYARELLSTSRAHQRRRRRAGRRHRRGQRLRPGLVADTDADLSEHDLARDGHVHPAVPELRRCLHRHRRGHQPPGGLRRRCGQAAAAGLRGHLPQLRRRVRAPRPAPCACGLSRSLPALRAGLPGPPGCPGVRVSPFRRALAAAVIGPALHRRHTGDVQARRSHGYQSAARPIDQRDPDRAAERAP